jgi:DNA-binding CsgD family transcriptional regulator/PAS domain-containing protein
MFENPEQAFGRTKRLLALIETIYAAVQEPLLWSVVMEGIAEAVHGESTSIFARFPENNLLSMTRTDSVAWDAYATYYASVNVLMQHCDEQFPDGSVRYAHRALSDASLEKTEFYNDFFRRHDMHYSMGLKVPLGEQPAAYITCQRPKSSGPFSEREGVVYETLLPHLQRALMLHLQLVQTQSQVLGLETEIDSLGHAVFGLDRRGRMILSNRQAESITQVGDAIRLLSGEMLVSVFPEQNQRLQACLSSAIAVGAGIGASSGGSLLLNRKSGKEPLRVSAIPFLSPLPGSSAQLTALVFVSDPASQPLSRGATLRALYALTPAEARIADLLLQGLETRDVANGMGLTLETARFHVKRVLAKTGTKRQTELMRLMLSLPQG